MGEEGMSWRSRDAAGVVTKDGKNFKGRAAQQG